MPRSQTKRSSGKVMNVHPYLCISAAELQIPFHSSTIILVRATDMRNRGLETSEVRSLVGGNRALTDFHETPPFGSNMLRWTLADLREMTIERMGMAMASVAIGAVR